MFSIISNEPFILFDENMSVKDHVLADFRAAEIFQRYGLDFCCGGGVSLEEACNEKQIDFESVRGEIEALRHVGRPVGGPAVRFQEWPLGFLASYIVENHHRYVRRMSPVILAHAIKVADSHGERFGYMIHVAALFSQVSQELASHMMKEEAILFPRIRQIELAANERTSGDLTDTTACFRSMIAGQITQMITEHEAAGEFLQKIRTLTNDFEIPEGACTTFRTLLKELEEFESDLHHHVFLENAIRFPKAVEMEEGL